jgi:hypothetical protein
MKNLRFPGLIVLLLSSGAANATLQQVGSFIQSLRVEAGVAYIAFDNPMPVCGSRVWVDPTSAQGKAVYATAMLAFGLNKPVKVRAYDESTRMNGACQLFDIFVAN